MTQTLGKETINAVIGWSMGVSKAVLLKKYTILPTLWVKGDLSQAQPLLNSIGEFLPASKVFYATKDCRFALRHLIGKNLCVVTDPSFRWEPEVMYGLVKGDLFEIEKKGEHPTTEYLKCLILVVSPKDPPTFLEKGKNVLVVELQ
jgi:hypothetical protein